MTKNFSTFDFLRHFASYCRGVLFENQSRTSVKGNKRISKFCNRQIKAYLIQAARTAVMHNPQLKEYYFKKRTEGKADKVVINNARNKLIHMMFAMIKNETVFDKNYIHPLQRKTA